MEKKKKKDFKIILIGATILGCYFFIYFLQENLCNYEMNNILVIKVPNIKYIRSKIEEFTFRSTQEDVSCRKLTWNVLIVMLNCYSFEFIRQLRNYIWMFVIPQLQEIYIIHLSNEFISFIWVIIFILWKL